MELEKLPESDDGTETPDKREVGGSIPPWPIA